MTEPVNLPEIFELAKKATPGEWSEYPNGVAIMDNNGIMRELVAMAPATSAKFQWQKDRASIVASRNALPAIEKAFGELKALAEELEHDQERIEGWDFGDDGAGDCKPSPFEEKHTPEKCRKCRLRAVLAKVGVKA